MSFELPDAGIVTCIFCSIVSGDADASWEARPNSDSKVACFHNRLKWARVMLLIVPTNHMTQEELWSSDVMEDSAALAVEIGDKHCGDEGFRVISNFGLQAHQSQPHGHIHIVSGTSRQLQNGVKKSGLSVNDGVCVEEYKIEETPFAARISPTENATQRELWTSPGILKTSRLALDSAMIHSPNGFRLMSSFDASSIDTPGGSNPASLYLLGGGQLGLYV